MIKKLMKSIVIMLFVSTGTVYSANITDKSGATGFAFLKIAQGTRASAMGECFTGLADDINSIYFNPAGLAQIKTREIVTNYTLWFADISRAYIGYVHPPFKFGTLGMSVNYVGVPFEKRTTEDDFTFQQTILSNMAVSVVYGRKINDKISAGSTIKYISEGLDIKTKTGVAIDFGGLYALNETVMFGASLQNIGMDMDSEYADPMPMSLRIGASKKIMDEDKSTERLILLSDLYVGLIDMTTFLSVGGEYKVHEMFRPRLGFKYRITNSNLDPIAGLSAGFGVRFNIYRLDYAFVPYGDLGLTHRIDFMVKF